MEKILTHLEQSQAIIIAAPPGWGKTYKLLEALSCISRKVIFIFPLRALCDEVFIAAEKKGIHVCNLTRVGGLAEIEWDYIQLVTATPECLGSLSRLKLPEDLLVVFDECHLIYYWGESFREKLLDCYIDILSLELPLILLSATLSPEIMKKLQFDLQFSYDDITFCDFGNQKLKNNPQKTFIYPKLFKNMLRKDLFFSFCEGIKLVFCQYREEVRTLSLELENLGFRVMSCVGGESKGFAQVIQNKTAKDIDFIVATSVVSHGVNLPEIRSIYFLYRVTNPDFYLQMVGRGGRDGSYFTIHSMQKSKLELVNIFQIFKNSISNSLRSYLYYLNAC